MIGFVGQVPNYENESSGYNYYRSTLWNEETDGRRIGHWASTCTYRVINWNYADAYNNCTFSLRPIIEMELRTFKELLKK